MFIKVTMVCLARRRHVLLLVFLIVLVPFCLFIFLADPDLSIEEKEITSKIAELRVKVKQLNFLHQERLQEVSELAIQLSNMLSSLKSNSSLIGASEEISEVQKLLENISSPGAVHMPSVHHFLPHLLYNPSSLKPSYQKTKGRNGVSMVLGVPTVKRAAQSYLLTTLQSLIQNLNQEEQNKTLIVVFVAETNLDYVLSVENEIETQFSSHVESGLIEIISPPASYYPDLTKLTPTLGDPLERFQWRSKQSLDFAFLMMYAQPRGLFYTQLEDDILAKPGYLTTMLDFAYTKIAANKPWLIIEFCQLGFIGKMFKSVDLPFLAQFFIMFYNEKPVDWLLDDVVTVKTCNPNINQKMCLEAKKAIWMQHRPSLFQHLGVHSSLNGKIQNLKDKFFGKMTLFYPHKTNPKFASTESSIASYGKHTLEGAYLGKGYFWGLYPKAGDHITFKYDPPINLSRYLFRSGNVEYPSDRFYNASVEILPAEMLDGEVTVTPDGYAIVGKFDKTGLAEGFINPKLFPISEIRLNIHSKSGNWVILSEVLIETKQES
ncbi:Hypothetical predicted protein [Cloeon dipterum]|uniref:Alpha-1,3-mannosyl-glycoprotein 4-beta-N-acetylglucosaminyltransferase A n=3 Tax=Cloeon dipterum TaxID=197152 RepID=A0A8S1BR95_9INSE|nr:Hypothetical predicted protein [Cloeon dipterum]